MKKQVIAALAVASMVGVGQAAIFSSTFDGHTGVPTTGYVKDSSGSTTAGVTWNTDTSVTAISDLTAITSGGGFVNQGATYSSADNLKVNYNLNNGNDQGYSLTFTIDSSWDLTTLTVLAGHSNDTGNSDQSYASDLHYSLSGGTLGSPVTGVSSEDYAIAPAYHTVGFDLAGTTIGAGTYTLDVFMNNLSTGGAYAIYNGITLNGDNGQQLPMIDSFGASSTSVFVDDTITLFWSVTGANTLILNPGAVDVSATNEIDVVVTADTTYELIAGNANGSVTSSVPVTVITTPPVIQSFTASSTNVFLGSEITLSWQVDDATGLSIDQGLGDVTGIISTQLVINADITYTLTATNMNGSSATSVAITVNQNPVLLQSDFDGTTGAQTIASADNSSGSATLGITDWTTHASVSSISDLTAISPGGTFVNMTGTAFASPDNVYINHNLNIDDRADPRGYSVTFTTDTSWNLGVLVVRAGHSNNTADQNQAFASDLTFVLSGGTLGAPVTQTALQVDYTGIAYIDTEFDMAGTTIGAGTYTLEVTANNMGGGGAYAVFDGILLATDAPKIAATLSIAGPVSSGTEMEISWMGDSGSSYRVETNSNLISGGWDTFQSGIPGNGGIITITNAIGPNQTFYRVITE